MTPRPLGPLDFRVQLESDHVTLSFSGRMEADEVRKIEHDVEFAISGPVPVIIDLRGLLFMESLGVALIVRTAKTLMASQIPLAVVLGTGSVARLFGMARLDKVLIIAFTLDDARAAIGLSPVM